MLSSLWYRKSTLTRYATVIGRRLTYLLTPPAPSPSRATGHLGKVPRSINKIERHTAATQDARRIIRLGGGERCPGIGNL